MKERKRPRFPRTIVPVSSDFTEAPVAHLVSEQWSKLKLFLPSKIRTGNEEELLETINEASEILYLELEHLELRADYAELLKPPGKRQSAPLAKLTKSVCDAANGWIYIRSEVLDPDFPNVDLGFGPGNYGRLDLLVKTAKSLSQRLEELTKIGLRKPDANPWNDYVRHVAQALCAAGFDPQWTKRVYEGGANPTWFQRFMLQLHECLPREAQKADVTSAEAFWSDVAQTMRGFRCRRAAR